MNGILLVNKDKDITSRDVVNKLTHIFKTKKIGHTGTLDPIATGLLICTIGKYTKLNLDLTCTYKEYVATMELGYETDTLDVTGKKIKTSTKKVTKENIIKVINAYQKSYLQEVPKYSSVKINGRKLYEYARNDEEVELPKRNVDIKEIEIININGKNIKFRCLVSKGTYIRSLIRDIGISLGTYATMSKLNRTKQDKFRIEDAYTLNDIEKGIYKFVELKDVLDLDIIECDDNMFFKVNNGIKMELFNLKQYVLFKYKEEDIALYKKDDDQLYHMYLKF